jgi:hypothetical protein
VTDVACSCCEQTVQAWVTLWSNPDIVICYQCLDDLNSRRGKQIAIHSGLKPLAGCDPVFSVVDTGLPLLQRRCSLRGLRLRAAERFEPSQQTLASGSATPPLERVGEKSDRRRRRLARCPSVGVPDAAPNPASTDHVASPDHYDDGSATSEGWNPGRMTFGELGDAAAEEHAVVERVSRASIAGLSYSMPFPSASNHR